MGCRELRLMRHQFRTPYVLCMLYFKYTILVKRERKTKKRTTENKKQGLGSLPHTPPQRPRASIRSLNEPTTMACHFPSLEILEA